MNSLLEKFVFIFQLHVTVQVRGKSTVASWNNIFWFPLLFFLWHSISKWMSLFFFSFMKWESETHRKKIAELWFMTYPMKRLILRQNKLTHQILVDFSKWVNSWDFRQKPEFKKKRSRKNVMTIPFRWALSSPFYLIFYLKCNFIYYFSDFSWNWLSSLCLKHGKKRK